MFLIACLTFPDYSSIKFGINFNKGNMSDLSIYITPDKHMYITHMYIHIHIYFVLSYLIYLQFNVTTVKNFTTSFTTSQLKYLLWVALPASTVAKTNILVYIHIYLCTSMCIYLWKRMFALNNQQLNSNNNNKIVEKDNQNTNIIKKNKSKQREICKHNRRYVAVIMVKKKKKKI